MMLESDIAISLLFILFVGLVIRAIDAPYQARRRQEERPRRHSLREWAWDEIERLNYIDQL